MQRPHLSTGAWIFATTALVLAVGAPISYAAVTSTVAIGNTGNSTTATVTASHQLLTTTIGPKNVVHADGASNGSCSTIYAPPAGKAIVVTSVTYDLFNNPAGQEQYAYLDDNSCLGSVDIADTTEADVTESHTFPIGLPIPAVALGYFGSGAAEAFVTGYLIPASQLPPARPATNPADLRRVPTHT